MLPLVLNELLEGERKSRKFQGSEVEDKSLEKEIQQNEISSLKLFEEAPSIF